MLRLRPALALSVCLAAFLSAGCGERKPIVFRHEPALDGPEFADRPKLHARVVEVTNGLFGDSPAAAHAPEASGLPVAPAAAAGETTAPESPLVQGAALYSRHCLHCHGLSGDGNGPTAPYVYPVPRDYRQGRFKFTSTGFGNKPSRDDLRRTIANGLDGTSMPAFSSQLDANETELLVDYVVFLSQRGEVERILTEEAKAYADTDLDAFDDALVEELAASVFDRWEAARAPEAVVRAAKERVPPSPESIARGRDLFLGNVTEVKLECAGCHGPRGVGDGPSWIDPETFNKYVFGGRPGPEQVAELKSVAEKAQKRWGDDWGSPLRPSNLNKGVYKGGRRPIDLYWRIANGINGTPMPAHASVLQNPDDIWHLVNFLLALPSDRDLLLPRGPAARVGLATPGGAPTGAR